MGSATVFLRISCFGRKIITQFELPVNQNLFFFKGNNNSPIFQCQRMSSESMIKTSLSQKKCVCKTEQNNNNVISPRFGSINQQSPTQLYNRAAHSPSSFHPQTIVNKSNHTIEGSSMTARKCGCPKAPVNP